MENKIIDLKNINNTDQDLIARRFLPLVEKFFDDKNVQSDFKKWLEIRRKK